MKLNRDLLIIASLVGVAAIALYLIHKKRDDDDNDDRRGGNRTKGPKQYPFSYWRMPYEDLDDIIEDVCDRMFKGKCKQECAGGATPACMDCLTVCEKTHYRMRK